MFKLEFIQLLNNYENASDEMQKKSILKSISNLISQNKQEYQNFIQGETLTPSMQHTLDDINLELQNSKDEIEQENSTNNDTSKIKQAFELWEKSYEQNNKEIAPQCIEIVEQLISYYEPNKFEVITKILEITMNQNYETFKNHIKNNLRSLYATKVEQYLNSENYENLSFFKKLKKKKELEKLIKELIKYNFDKKQIQEVLK